MNHLVFFTSRVVCYVEKEGKRDKNLKTYILWLSWAEEGRHMTLLYTMLDLATSHAVVHVQSLGALWCTHVLAFQSKAFCLLEQALQSKNHSVALGSFFKQNVILKSFVALVKVT